MRVGREERVAYVVRRQVARDEVPANVGDHVQGTSVGVRSSTTDHQ
jgi:hypothetical protein